MQMELLERPANLTRAAARKAALAAAQERGERAAEAAGRRANTCAPGWVEQAAEALRKFACAQAGVFSIEQARAVLAAELPAVPELRAWGRAVQIASRLGYIEQAPRVYIPTACGNGTARPGWRRGRNA